MGKKLVKKVGKKSDPAPRQKGRPRVTVSTPLTRKQELFVKELVSKDGQITMRDAAINAGYPASSAHTRAYELTNPYISPHVCASIKKFRNELDEKFGVTYQRHLRDLQVIRDLALENNSFSAAVMAETRRGLAQGDIYVSKSEIRTGSIDSMSKEEVVKALEDLKQQYAPLTIDITPNDKTTKNTSNRNKARKRVLSTDEESDEQAPPEVRLN